MNTQFKPGMFGQFESPRIDESFRPGASVVSALSGAWAALSRMSARRRARAALSEFDDRMLRDIGITRMEIEHMVRYGNSGRVSD
jgi:uncharacterized protein YjiS (DUF1127 family)